MEQGLSIPPGITNEALWRKHCRQIRARAQDLLDGRLGVIETARALVPLASWTRSEDTPEFQIFRAIDGETCFFPLGEVRNYWAAEALAREDVAIHAAEEQWRQLAITAAATLVQRYAWATKPPKSQTRE